MLILQAFGLYDACRPRSTIRFDLKVPGFYQAAIIAVQKSTGNLGTGMVTFFTKP